MKAFAFEMSSGLARIFKICAVLISLLIVSAKPARASNVLIIGDSLSCGSFGSHLVQDMTTATQKVTLVCAVSSRPSNWLMGKNPGKMKCEILTSSSRKPALCGGTGQVPTLASLLSAHHGERVVVALGTNSLLSPRADSSYRKMAEAIRKSGASCDWIGPPHVRADQSRGFGPGRLQKLEDNLNPFYDSLGSSVDQDCTLHDSREITARGEAGSGTVDGVHRDEASGKAWAASLQGSLNEKNSVSTHHRAAPLNPGSSR